ncbi:MAG: hypothetical protein ACFCGT_18610 [Sandaracinaceae bacterium]
MSDDLPTEEQRERADEIQECVEDILAEGANRAESIADELRSRGLDVPASMGELLYDLVTQQALTSVKLIKKIQDSNDYLEPYMQALGVGVCCEDQDKGETDHLRTRQYGRRSLIEKELLSDQTPLWLKIPIRNRRRVEVEVSASWESLDGRLVESTPPFPGRQTLAPREETRVRAVVTVNDQDPAVAGDVVPATLVIKLKQEVEDPNDPSSTILDEVDEVIQPFEFLVQAP